METHAFRAVKIVMYSVCTHVHVIESKISSALLDIILLNIPDQSSRRPRMPSMTRARGRKMLNGKSLHGRLKSMKLPKER